MYTYSGFHPDEVQIYLRSSARQLLQRGEPAQHTGSFICGLLTLECTLTELKSAMLFKRAYP